MKSILAVITGLMVFAAASSEANATTITFGTNNSVPLSAGDPY